MSTAAPTSNARARSAASARASDSVASSRWSRSARARVAHALGSNRCAARATASCSGVARHQSHCASAIFHAAAGLDARGRLSGRTQQPSRCSANRSPRNASRQRGPVGCVPRRGAHRGEPPLAVPVGQRGREAPVLRALAAAHRPGQLVGAGRGDELAAVDHAAEGDAGGAFGDPERAAPLHQSCAGHPGRVHPEQQARDDRARRQRPFEERRRITFCRHLLRRV